MEHGETTSHAEQSIWTLQLVALVPYDQSTNLLFNLYEMSAASSAISRQRRLHPIGLKLD
jgi:hypothetical protein